MTSGGETSWPEYFRRLQSYLQWQTEQITALQRKVASLETELAAVKEQKGVRIDRIEYSFDQLKVEKLEGTLNIGVTPGGLQSIEEFAVNGQTTSVGAKSGPVGGVGPMPGQTAAANANGQPGQPMSGTAGPYGTATPPYVSGPGGQSYPYGGDSSSIPSQPRDSASDPAGTDMLGGAADWVQEIGNQIKSYLDEDVASDLRSWVEQHRLPLDPESQRLVLDDIRAQLDERVRHYAKDSGNRAYAGQSFDAVAREIIERTKRDIRIAIQQYMTSIQPAEEDPS